MLNVKLIGVGGIGTNLLPSLVRYLAYQRQDAVTLTLIDGDRFEARNAERQIFQMEDQGNKAEAMARMLLGAGMFEGITVRAIPEFVTSANVRDVVRRHDIVLLAVDNHKTRWLVAQRCKQLWDVTLISGGNDFVDGSVLIHMRRGRKNLTNPIDVWHPEIRFPKDTNPGEDPSCLELAAGGEPQLVVANMAAALGMEMALYQVLEGRIPPEEIYFDVEVGSLRPVRRVFNGNNG
jgi:predicted dinucleotide-binding enzyme